jgi:tRNA acetyltransferase TAN1
LNQLSNAIDNSKKEIKEKAKIFQALESSQKGNVFIRADIPEFYELIINIVNDLARTKVRKTKLINRIIPIENVCRANLEEIVNAAGELFDKHFLKEPHTFAINFNRKLNKSIDRDDAISRLADLIHQKNIKNKVNLKEPERTVIVEIQKGLCMLSVVPDYIKLKKYNLHSLAKSEEEEDDHDESAANEDNQSQEVPKEEEK